MRQMAPGPDSFLLDASTNARQQVPEARSVRTTSPGASKGQILRVILNWAARQGLRTPMSLTKVKENDPLMQVK